MISIEIFKKTFSLAIEQFLVEVRISPKSLLQGLALAGNIGAMNYFECSAVTGLGMEEIAKEAIRVVEAQRRPPPKETIREKIEENCVLQ